jgi:phospholipase D
LCRKIKACEELRFEVKKNGFLQIIIIITLTAFTNQPIFSVVSAFFSPEDKITNKLIERIKNANSSIYAAVYLICDHRVSDALIAAKKDRNLDIKIIVDQLSVSKYGKADILAQNGIEVYLFNPSLRSPIQQQKSSIKKNTAKPSQDGSIVDERWWGNEAIMHNKFAIIDNSTVITGSFNWTNAADKKNCENIVIIEKDLGVSARFSDYFTRFLRSGACPRYFPDRMAPKIQTELEKKIIQAIETTHNEAELFLALEKVLANHSKN